MLDNKPLLIGLGAVALVGVSVFVMQLLPRANNQTFPEGMDFLCPNGHEFNRTVAQMDDFFENHYGEELPCPTCGAKPSRRADRDPRTGKLKVRERYENAPPPPEGTDFGGR